MSKKSGISIDFNAKKTAKDLVKKFDKNKKNVRVSGKCPSCNKETKLDFKNGKAKCSRCGVVFDQG